MRISDWSSDVCSSDLFIAASAGDWALLLAAAGLMFAVFGQVTINDALVVRFTTDEWRARAYSLRYLLSFGVSAATVPMVAFLHDHGDRKSTRLNSSH